MKRKEKKRKLKYEFPPYIAISHDHEQDGYPQKLE